MESVQWFEQIYTLKTCQTNSADWWFKKRLTFNTIGFNTKAVITGDFKAQVRLIHVGLLSDFRGVSIVFWAQTCTNNKKKNSVTDWFMQLEDFFLLIKSKNAAMMML